MTRTRLTLIASRPIVIAAILLGIATSASAVSPRFERPGQSSGVVQQPPSPTQTESADPCAPVYNIGGSIRPPVLTYLPDVRASKDSRDARFSGNISVGLIVGRDGKPCNVHVVRGVGTGVDESAINAVQHYKFKPAKQNGKPVAVNLMIEVNYNYALVY